MTRLTKPVRRSTTAPVSHAIRPLTLTLTPGGKEAPSGLLILREHGRRKGYALDIRTLYLQAVQAEAAGRRRLRWWTKKGRKP